MRISQSLTPFHLDLYQIITSPRLNHPQLQIHPALQLISCQGHDMKLPWGQLQTLCRHLFQLLLQAILARFLEKFWTATDTTLPSAKQVTFFTTSTLYLDYDIKLFLSCFIFPADTTSPKCSWSNELLSASNCAGHLAECLAASAELPCSAPSQGGGGRGGLRRPRSWADFEEPPRFGLKEKGRKTNKPCDLEQGE